MREPATPSSEISADLPETPEPSSSSPEPGSSFGDPDPHVEFLPWQRQTFGPDNCFICGRAIPPGDSQRTREHVFPKWLQKQLSLRDSTLTSINGQTIKYGLLTVPCCVTCNGHDFSIIENRVKDAFASGLSSVRALDRRDLFLWLGKIYYGIVYLESLRTLSIRDPSGPPLVPASHLQTNRFHHFLLHAASHAVTWEPPTPGPASFLFYECQDDPAAPEYNFDYCDNLFSPILAIRAGRIGIIAVLQDWGYMETITEKRLVSAQRLELHPTQFRELYAMVSYLVEANVPGGRAHVVIKSAISDVPATVITPEVPLSDSGQVEIPKYARYLASALQAPLEEIFNGAGVQCFTIDDQGFPLRLPWPGALFVGLSGRELWPGGSQIDIKV